MSKTLTDDERAEFLKGVGLSDKGDTLAVVPKRPPTHQPATSEGIVLAPPGIDPRAMPVDEITFDPRLLDQFPSLEGEGMRAASAYVFSLYKSYSKGDRNKVLHRKISTFITTTRAQRKSGGLVKEKVKTTAEERDLAQVIAASGITASELAELLKGRA